MSDIDFGNVTMRMRKILTERGKKRFNAGTWAAMQFLNRSVRVRSRELRLKDLILLCVRCLAILLLAAALAKPFVEDGRDVPAGVGESRAGVSIALDASFSMAHSDGTATRFERAIEKIGTITENIHPGDPVSLVLLKL